MRKLNLTAVRPLPSGQFALSDLPGAEREDRAALRYHEGWQPALDALSELESGD